MRRTLATLAILTLLGSTMAVDAWAGAKLKISDDASLDLGIRIQPYVIMKDADVNGDGEFDSITDFKTRRARSCRPP